MGPSARYSSVTFLWCLSLVFGGAVPKVSSPGKDEDFPRGISGNLAYPFHGRQSFSYELQHECLQPICL